MTDLSDDEESEKEGTVCHLNHITVHDGMPRPKAKVAISDTKCQQKILISTEHLFDTILSLDIFGLSLARLDNSCISPQ